MHTKSSKLISHTLLYLIALSCLFLPHFVLANKKQVQYNAIVKYCQYVSPGAFQDTNMVSPTSGLRELIKKRGFQYTREDKVTVTLLRGPRHGRLTNRYFNGRSRKWSTLAYSYVYYANRNYYGKDSMVFLVETNNKKIKVLYHVLVMDNAEDMRRYGSSASTSKLRRFCPRAIGGVKGIYEIKKYKETRSIKQKKPTASNKTKKISIIKERKETYIGQILPTAIKYRLMVSPNGKRFAYTAGADGKKYSPEVDDGYVVAVVDNKQGIKYNFISTTQFGQIKFSSDSKKYAYLAAKGRESFVIINGEEKRRDSGIIASSIIFSPDGKRVAYASHTFVVVDGVRGKRYDRVSYPKFSPDGKRVAYAAKSGGRSFVIVDGQPQKLCAANPVFSPDSKRLACTAGKQTLKSREFYTVLDGKKGKVYEHISYLKFSPDSKNIAYVARTGKKWIVVHDGKEIAHYDTRPFGLNFSPDSNKVFYVVRKGRKRTLVYGNKVGDLFRMHSKLKFSLDGKRFAYIGFGDKGRHAVIDWQKSKSYYRVRGLAFSPDSKRVAYAASSNGKWFVVVNGVKGKEYDDIAGNIVFSPDSKHIAYAAKKNSKWFIVINNTEGKAYKLIFGKIYGTSNRMWSSTSPGSLHFDSPKGLHYLAIKNSNRVYLVAEKLR